MRLPSLRARDPSIHRPSRPPPGAGPAGRPGGQPAVVLAPTDPGRLRRRRPAGVGRRGPRPRTPPRRGRPGAVGRARRGRRLRPAARCREGRPRRLPERRPLVPAQGRRRRAPRDRLLLAGVRHHGRAAAVLRRPRHPRRRPPQGRQRPRRPARGRRPALQERVLQAVAVARGLAGGDLPGPRPRRAAPVAAARGRRHPRHRRHRDARRARPGRPRSGSPRSVASRCCCSTPTSRATPTTTAR